MSSRERPSAQQEGPDRSQRAAPRPEALFERLVHQVGPRGPGRAAMRSRGEVILRLDREDARYELVRKPRRRRALRVAPRQLEVAMLVAEGLSDKRIATQLGVRMATVNTHMRRLFKRLGVHTRAALIAALASAGLLK